MNQNDPSAKQGFFNYSDAIAVVGVAYAIYASFNKSIGDAIFGIVLAMLGGLSKSTIANKRLSYVLIDVFRHGDKVARLLIVTLAIGGSALSVDLIFSLNLFHALIDAAAKRAAIPLIALGLTFYVGCSFVKWFGLIDKEHLGSYSPHLMAYLASIVAFNLFFSSVMLGLPVEAVLSNWTNDANDSGAVYPVWDTDSTMFKILLVGIPISLIWSIAGLANSISEDTERRFRDNVK